MNAAISPLTQAMGDEAPVSRRVLKDLMKRRSNRIGLIRLAWWFAAFAGTGALVWAAGSEPLLLIPAMFLHGLMIVHHFALQHECSHYTPFRSRRLCNILGGYCGFLLVIPPNFFRYEHCDHHTYTNLHGRDPEMIELPISVWKYLAYLSSIPYWRSQFGGLFRRALGRLTEDEKRFIPRSEYAAIIRESRVMIAGYSAIVLAMVAFGWTAPLFYWWLPMFMAEPVMRFIRMTEHVGRPMVENMQENTRTNIVSAPWRFLNWNMNYHAEHHYASSVPFHALPALHEELKDHVYVEKHGYLSAHIDILSQMVRPKGPASDKAA